MFYSKICTGCWTEYRDNGTCKCPPVTTYTTSSTEIKSNMVKHKCNSCAQDFLTKGLGDYPLCPKCEAMIPYLQNPSTVKTYDSVNHPSHYTMGKVEVINAIEDWKLDYHRGNAVKYIARAGRKNPDTEIEDLEKAIWYLKREVERLKNANVT